MAAVDGILLLGVQKVMKTPTWDKSFDKKHAPRWKRTTRDDRSSLKFLFVGAGSAVRRIVAFAF